MYGSQSLSFLLFSNLVKAYPSKIYLDVLALPVPIREQKIKGYHALAVIFSGFQVRFDRESSCFAVENPDDLF